MKLISHRISEATNLLGLSSVAAKVNMMPGVMQVTCRRKSMETTVLYRTPPQDKLAESRWQKHLTIAQIKFAPSQYISISLLSQPANFKIIIEYSC